MENSIQKISIIGLGNVGSNLYQAFIDNKIDVTHVVSRTEPESFIKANSKWITDPNELPEDQFVLVCVPDSLISSVISSVPRNCPIAYTSGSIELQSLEKGREIGVFYPLQTFTKGHKVDLFEVPFFVESESPEFASRLSDLAWTISKNVNYASSSDRKKLHLAAVFINNFTNHLTYLAQNYLDGENLNFEHLKPLLKETARKLEHQDPFKIQTGPARRNDQTIIENHIEALGASTAAKIYREISRSIHETYFHD